MLWRVSVLAYLVVMGAALGARQSQVDPAATIESARASLQQAIKAATLDAAPAAKDVAKEPGKLAQEVIPAVLSDRRVIVAVREMLEALEYDPGPSSGELSPKMSSATTEFQIWHRLPPTGRLSEQLLNNLLSKCQIAVSMGGLGVRMSMEGACPKPEEVQGMGVYKVRMPGGGPNEGTIMKRPDPVK